MSWGQTPSRAIPDNFLKHYNLIVIGAESGGLMAAVTARKKGLHTALVEKNPIGVEGPHPGSIPSKSFLASVKVWQQIQNRARWGLQSLTTQGHFHFGEIMENVRAITQKVYDEAQPEHFEQQGIDVYVHSTGAEFLNPHTLKIGPEILHFERALICTGSSPKIPSLPGLSQINFLTNENFWDLKELPKSIAFIGGGVIATELGQALATLGCEVFILESKHDILTGVDPDIRGILRSRFDSQNIACLTNLTIQSLEQQEDAVLIRYESEGRSEQLRAEKIFISAGRSPNKSGLNLYKAGIPDSGAEIKINSFLQTQAPHIYACGDVAAGEKFAHAASAGAELALQNMLENNSRPYKPTDIPWVIFSSPEIAHVGLSESEAYSTHGPKIHTLAIKPETGRFLTEREAGGLLKIVLSEDNTVLGADAIGHQAGEWIQLIHLVISNNISLQKISETVFPYPTHGEIVKTAFVRYLQAQRP